MIASYSNGLCSIYIPYTTLEQSSNSSRGFDYPLHFGGCFPFCYTNSMMPKRKLQQIRRVYTLIFFSRTLCVLSIFLYWTDTKQSEVTGRDQLNLPVVSNTWCLVALVVLLSFSVFPIELRKVSWLWNKIPYGKGIEESGDQALEAKYPRFWLHQAYMHQLAIVKCSFV